MSRWPDKHVMQERLLATADRLFYRQGIRAISVDDVADEARVSKRTLYNYYPSKDALVVAYLSRRAIPLEITDDPPEDQLLDVFDRLREAISRRSFRGCPFVNAVTEVGDSVREATKLAVAFKDARREWFRRLLARLNVRDPSALAIQLAMILDGAIATALVRGEPGAADAAKDAAIILLANSRHSRRAQPRRGQPSKRPRSKFARHQ